MSVVFVNTKEGGLDPEASLRRAEDLSEETVVPSVRLDSAESDERSLESCSFHATALRSRIRLASVTRRLKRGSVARVRKVSLRILVYSGERPRWIRER